MYNILKTKLTGLQNPMQDFSGRLSEFNLDERNMTEFITLISQEMKKLDFDEVVQDHAGNIIGIINGYDAQEDLILISHMDFSVFSGLQSFRSYQPELDMLTFKAGIISSIYAGGLMKRVLMPLKGNLIVCCVPRSESCGIGIKYLFDNFLRERRKHIQGVILCEPTDFNINLGHKGKMEYEIVVKGKIGKDEFFEQRGINMLGTMFPLINELEKYSQTLPRDFTLGPSSLRIKDVSYSGYGSPYQPLEDLRECRVVVDRTYVPEEREETILNKAKSIAKSVYREKPEVIVDTAVATRRVKTLAGTEVIAEKEYKPWRMEEHHPFVLSSLGVLRENGFNATLGYWKKIITEGSYTCGELQIPTIGFGAGSEEMLTVGKPMISIDDLAKSVYGQTLIIHRNLGMPTFGWCEDEI
ncbi:MAG: peptidase dimerization domain-containing protein [bacterium]|nr:peptidase dimerization domain-containing protein [bacterium]